MTGMLVVSASSCNCAEAPDARTPWPVMISGRSASLIRRAASCRLLRVSSHSSGALGRNEFGENRVGQFQLHVAGDVDQHRAGPAFLRDGKGLAESAGQAIGRHHHEALLGAGVGDGADVAFLERLGAQGRARDLPGDGDHRQRIGLGPHDAGDEVGGAGPGGGDADAHFATDAGVGVGGVGGGLFVADQDVPQLRV